MRSLVGCSPNAGHQARREAEAKRTLYAVACMPLFGADAAKVPPRSSVLHPYKQPQ